MKIATMTRASAKALGEQDAMRMLARAGFDGVDYSFHTYGLASPLLAGAQEDMESYYRELRQVLEDCGLKVCQCHALYPTYTGSELYDEPLYQSILRTIQIADILGSPYLVVHPAIPVVSKANCKRKETGLLNRAFYLRMLPCLREHSVQIGIENMFSCVEGQYLCNAVSTAEDMVSLIDQLNELASDERFVACFDCGHAHLLGLDIAKCVRTLDKRLKLLHLHDNDQNIDAHRAPWQGTADWNALMLALKEIDYQGWLSFEADGTLSSYPANMIEDVAKLLCCSGRHLAGIIENVQHQ